MTTKLSLGPLPKTSTVRVAVTLPAPLAQQLDRYAAAHKEMWGEAVTAASLIPHILEAFISRDRGFRSIRNSKVPR